MISPDFLMLIIICLFLCLLICLGPLFASNASCIYSVLFLRALFLFHSFVEFCIFYLVFLCFGLFCFFVFCRNSFLFLSKLSMSVPSILFLIVDFCVLFYMVSIDYLRILFIFFVEGSWSFRMSNLFLKFYSEWSG